MKQLLVGLLAFLSLSTFAASKTITCSYQWKNTDAAQNEFSFKVEALGTAKAKIIVTSNEDEVLKVISGVKESQHDADIMLREVGIENPAEVYTSAKEDLTIQIGDGISSEVFIKIYKNSNYRSGFITVHCDESYCGEFNYYSTLKCK